VVLKVNLETLDDPVPQVYKVLEDLQEEEGGGVLWVKMESKVNLDKMERMEKQDLKGYLAFLVHQDLVEIRVPWENKVHRETQGLLVYKVQEEILVKMVFLVNREILVHQELLEREVHQDLLGLEDSRVCLDHQEKMVCQERMEVWDSRDHQE